MSETEESKAVRLKLLGLEICPECKKEVKAGTIREAGQVNKPRCEPCWNKLGIYTYDPYRTQGVPQ